MQSEELTPSLAFCIYIKDGRVVAGPPRLLGATQSARPLNYQPAGEVDVSSATDSELLDLQENEDSRVRDAATQELLKRARRNRGTFDAVKKDRANEERSPEANERCRRIMSEIRGERQLELKQKLAEMKKVQEYIKVRKDILDDPKSTQSQKDAADAEKTFQESKIPDINDEIDDLEKKIEEAR